jgi:hypothetical protein
MNTYWKLREPIGSDIPFIYSSWMKSYRYGSHIGKSCKNSILYSNFYKIIDYILSQDNTKILVASHLDDPLIVFGYMVAQPNVIHYCFVKEDFLRFGIAKSLYEEIGGIYFTFKTMAVIPELVFNPFLLYKGV